MAAEKLLTSTSIISALYHRLTIGDTSWVNRYAMKIDSNQEIESYAFLGMAPTMREWIGGRQAKGLSEYSFQVRNKDHEATLEVLVKELRRDKSGQIRLRINDLARRVLSYPAKLVSTLMQNGESQLCYDGSYFFDTAHVSGKSGSQANKIQVDISELPVGADNHGSVSVPHVLEFQQAVLKGVQQLLALKDDQGEPLNEGMRTFEVMVPTSMWAIAQAALALPVLSQGQANIIPAMSDFKIVPVVNPRLTWTTKFAIVATDGETKPFIIQEEVPLGVDAIAEGSELEFKEKKHWYGVDWTGEVAFGLWQHAVLVELI
ncbi:Mu-like prophage major head subunit gpT family protein [Pseudorhodoplanes sp.]|uniref:Mu-like prophage major head subunit gpT family protein n=1 Tax=Pseudorhodoplanes sp. TaxID=1934341 RepID=UPI003D0DDAEE